MCSTHRVTRKCSLTHHSDGQPIHTGPTQWIAAYAGQNEQRVCQCAPAPAARPARPARGGNTWHPCGCTAAASPAPLPEAWAAAPPALLRPSRGHACDVPHTERTWSIAVAATDMSGMVMGRILPGSCARRPQRAGQRRSNAQDAARRACHRHSAAIASASAREGTASGCRAGVLSWRPSSRT